MTIDHKRWQKLNQEIRQRHKQGRFRIVTATGKLTGEVDKGIPLSYSINARPSSSVKRIIQ